MRRASNRETPGRQKLGHEDHHIAPPSVGMAQESREGGDPRSTCLESSAEQVILGWVSLPDTDDLPGPIGRLIPIEEALDGFLKLRESFRAAEPGARSAEIRLVLPLPRQPAGEDVCFMPVTSSPFNCRAGMSLRIDSRCAVRVFDCRERNPFGLFGDLMNMDRRLRGDEGESDSEFGRAITMMRLGCPSRQRTSRSRPTECR
jgi:hypothetical protein